ncbi:hypothetical protein D3C73_1591900 [compost metagenome]
MPMSRPTSQNPESLTWLANTDPAAAARVMAATSITLKPPLVTAGASRPAVVTSATVAEP